MVCRLCEHTEGPVGSPLAGAIFYRSTSVRTVHSLVHSSTPAVLIKEMSHSAQIKPYYTIWNVGGAAGSPTPQPLVM